MDVLRYVAFSDRPDGGNPAGVVLDASGLSEAEMLGIAADVGYSETAFVDGDDIRYFSPLAEVPFCGHATVATAIAIAEREGPGTLPSVLGRRGLPAPRGSGRRFCSLAAAPHLDFRSFILPWRLRKSTESLQMRYF